MGVKLANNASSRLGVSLSETDVQVVLETGGGAKFPLAENDGDWFPLTLVRSDGAIEIVHASGRIGDTILVSRGQEGTQARDFSAGDIAELRITAGSLSAISDKADAVGGELEDLSESFEDLESSLRSAAFVDIGSGAQEIPTGQIMTQAIEDAVKAITEREVGAVIYRTGTEPAEDEIVAEGQEVSREDFPELWDFAQASGNITSDDASWTSGKYSPGDGESTFRVPDLRGEFLRGWSKGRHIDEGREFGSVQEDRLQEHGHRFPRPTGDSSGGGYYYSSSIRYAMGSGESHALTPASGSTLGQGRIGNVQNSGESNVNAMAADETRPRNVGYLPCIKVGRKVLVPA